MRFALLATALAAIVPAAAPLVAAPQTSAEQREADRRARGEAELAKKLEGRVAGEPVNCISLSRLRRSEVIPHVGILYRDGGRVYLNRPTSGADQLDESSILVTRTTINQLCSVDTVQLVDRASRFWNGFVQLGEFVPYERVERGAR